MQRYKIVADNRAAVVNKLEEITGEKAVYTKMPRCAFVLRSITVEKNGTIAIEDLKDQGIVDALQALGMIEPVIEKSHQEADAASEEMTEDNTIIVMLPIHPKIEIAQKNELDVEGLDPCAYDRLIEEPEPVITPIFTFPITEYGPEALCNLVYTIYSKGKLISKLTGGYFYVSEELVESMQASYFANVQEVVNAIERCGPYSLYGMAIAQDMVVFKGFPATNDQELMDAWQTLFDAINTTAINQRHIRPKRLDEPNEKYALRNWLTRLGMNGPELKKTRWYLYKKLTGNTAFRTPEYADYLKRRRQERNAKMRDNSLAVPQFLDTQGAR